MLKDLIYILILFTITSCNTNRNDKIYKDLPPGNDYASLFSISDSGNYYKLDIYSPWQGGNDIVISYYLAKEIDSIPSSVDPYKKIRIPINKCVCLSTTHIAMINAANSVESIVGVSGTDYVSNPSLVDRIESGLVKDIGYDSNLNTELITSLNPDVVFVYGIGAESASYISKLESVNIPALYICDYLEVHPLARAEWLKLFGLLYNEETRTDSLYFDMKNKYESIKDSIQKSDHALPKVMVGLPYKDKWFISPGNSYINTLISDAGGEYIWNEYISNESMPLSIETVFKHALESDFWINIGNVETKKELISIDNRFEFLKPVYNNCLYNNILRKSARGGNDYWESGVISPHLVLLDIAAILHPELFPGHKYAYYMKVN